ncbi:MAG: hypothetical protein HY342_13605 [Candidatus Lambdaproteobacteria bacterium]|nr:hypothetical protein [Candidatus Lambdaproteobacteria bacterium]
MESIPSQNSIQPPWGYPGFLTEDALRAAQEYFFQTHATNSRMIAEGRSAQGFMKGHLRRKLSKEIGEDFKMYTGTSLGGGGKPTAESMGIRGELNTLLENVYRKIALNKPITSPSQEDVTILKHHLGALEVCFGLVYFYTSLIKRYTSLAGHRKVLKSVLDEELFKWIWRMCIGFLVSEDPQRLDFTSRLPSTGLNYIPREKQVAPSPEKLLAIGDFLLGTTMAESHLRFPLIYYFVTYVKHLQYQLLHQPGVNAEQVYDEVHRYVPDQPVEDVLTCIDIMMNMRGNSQQSFDDVLKNTEQMLGQFIPENEQDFILQYQEFTEGKITQSLAKIVPQARKPGDEEEGGRSLMPLLLVLRASNYKLRDAVFAKLPGPYLGLLANRVTHPPVDDADKVLQDHLKEAIQNRQKKGETYTVVGARAGKSKSEKIAEATAQTDGAAAPAAAPAPAPVSPDARLIVTWQLADEGIAVTSISARELVSLVGPDPRFLKFWVVYALQTGQVFRIAPEQINKETLTRLLHELLSGGALKTQPRLSKEQRQQLLGIAAKGPRTLLTSICKAVPKERAGQAGELSEGIAGLSGISEQLADIYVDPNPETLKGLREGLGPKEKNALNVLFRVIRMK